MTSTGSVLAIQYKGGVLLACDTAVCYGSLTMIPNISRCFPIGKNIIISSTGSYADFQHIAGWAREICTQRELEAKVSLSPDELFALLQRYMYDMRSKMKPLFSTVVVAGVSSLSPECEPFIGVIDNVGTHWVGKYAGTAYAQHIAVPLVREFIEQHGIPENREMALELLQKCMRVLFYRDCKSVNRWLISDVSMGGVQQAQPKTLDTNFSLHGFEFDKTALLTL